MIAIAVVCSYTLSVYSKLSFECDDTAINPSGEYCIVRVRPNFFNFVGKSFENAEKYRNVFYLVMKLNVELVELPLDIFTTFPEVIELSASANISKVNSDAFVGAQYLQKLDLRDNQIEQVQSNTFVHLTFVNYLWLSRNKIQEIEPEAFSGMTNLLYIELNKNKLTKIKNGAFKGANKLEFIIIQNNQIITH